MTTTAVVKPDPKAERRLTIRSLFQQQRPELSKLLPKNMSLDRLERIALTECTKNPKLLECSAESWALAMQTCAAQGLSPDSGLGYMYLIPRENSKKRGNDWIKVMEVTAQRGYQGDIQLARNSGELLDIYADVVYGKDKFSVKKGLNRTIEHEPYLGDDDPGPLVHCYAVAKLRTGETAWVTLTKRDVMRHKAASQTANNERTRDKSPWTLHEAAMWKKTAIHELAKWLPKATEAMEQLARGDEPDTTVIDVSASVPVTAERPPLEQVKDLLRAEAGEVVDTKTGEVVGGDAPSSPSPEREPGSDDGDEETVREFVERTAPPPTEPPVAANCEHPGLTVPAGKVYVCEHCTLEVRGPWPATATTKPRHGRLAE